MSGSRVTTTAGRLARLGFTDPETSSAALDRLGPVAAELVHLLAATADPDLAVCCLADLADRVSDRDDLLRVLTDDEGSAMRLLVVLGASAALGDHLLRHPEHWRDLTDPLLGSVRPPAFVLRASLLEAVGADPADPAPCSTLPDAAAVDSLRVEYRRLLIRLVSRDLSHGVGVDDVAAELSDLAAGTLEAALAIARTRVGDQAASARLAVDRDGQVRWARAQLRQRRGRRLRRRAGRRSRRARRRTGRHDAGVEPDADLLGPHRRGDDLAGGRGAAPGGPVRAPRAGPLASHVGYYEKWAKTWEFQALLKARPVAGDAAARCGVRRPILTR